MARPEAMYQCQGAQCGYIYNPDKGCKKAGRQGHPLGTGAGRLPLPSCGAGKKFFRPLAGGEKG